MLVSTKEMLQKAYEGHYAVGAFNVENLEFVMAAVRAAQAKHSPIILQTTPGTLKYANVDYFKAMVSVAAESVDVPVALHLDHGDTFERCVQAIRAGYTSVMIDGSHVDYQSNLALTTSVTKVAEPIGLPVEAELGKVGGKEDDGPLAADENPYTDPEQAAEFIAKTHCTSLAVGVGTIHGVYKGTPHIEQGVLKEIKARTNVPLVLHGTSGVPDDQVAQAIQNGICKVNYATELRQVFTAGFMKYMGENPACFDPKKPFIPAQQAIFDIVASHMDNLGSTNKA